jgi:hypothetical protein
MRHILFSSSIFFVYFVCIVSAARLACNFDKQPFVFPDEDLDDITRQPDPNTCENQVQAAIKCRDAFLHSANITGGKPDATILSWSLAAMVNPKIIKQLIADTSEDVYQFISNLGEILDKVEMFEIETVRKNASAAPAVGKTVSRKMMVAQQLGKIKSPDYRTLENKKETLAKSAFISLGTSLGVSRIKFNTNIFALN